MITLVDTSAMLVRLQTDCCDSQEARGLFAQLSSGNYDRCSVFEVPGSLDEWMAGHRTARKRVWRAERRGYTFRPLAREHHADDIYLINTSASRRQGRPMSAGYLERPVFSPLPGYGCDRHRVSTWGVWTPDDRLVAYLVMIRAGELALVSQILGHADHLEHEIMWLLFARALEQEIPTGGVCVYNRHDSGTDGLRWFKERCGFTETLVEWAP